MAQAVTKQVTRLSDLFTDPMVADAFRRAEDSTPPEAVAVEPDRSPELTDGAAERVLELA